MVYFHPDQHLSLLRKPCRLGSIMTRSEFVLAVLSTANRHSFTPVQLQKMFFILDREIHDEIDGPLFAFEPYHYGPFDHEVYRELETLQNEEEVDCDKSLGSNYRTYATTEVGQERGEQLLKSLDESTQAYIAQVSEFVRDCSFAELVSVIYKEYPDMKENSVFQ